MKHDHLSRKNLNSGATQQRGTLVKTNPRSGGVLCGLGTIFLKIHGVGARNLTVKNTKKKGSRGTDQRPCNTITPNISKAGARIQRLKKRRGRRGTMHPTLQRRVHHDP